MKKLFFIILAPITGIAWPSAGFSDSPLCKIVSYTGGNFLTGVNYTYDLSCYNTGEELNACTQCSAYNTTTTNGVVVTTTKEMQGNVNNTTYTIMCMCKTKKTTATCAAGYYGTGSYSLLNGASGCIECPDNATCAGGNNSTFTCNIGYYANGAKCERCPSSGGVYGTTASSGATSITSCYIPAGETSWTDSTGTYVCGENSYYEN